VSVSGLGIVLPRVDSFTPVSGVVGDLVTIDGANFDGATDVTFNGVSSSAFTVVSGTQITAVVPAGATTGKIGVTTPSGSGSSSADFVVLPKITSFSPASGAVDAVVIVSGTTLDEATDVSFNGVSADFTADSGTQITAVVPAGATTGKVAVTTPLGTATSVGNFNVLPKITSFTPTSGAVGAVVIISGTTFDGATEVSFNGVSAEFTADSGTQITAVVPAGATTGKITVTTLLGTATSAGNFNVLPKITSFTPASGAVGAVVIISGTTFDGVTEVSFNGMSADFTVDSNTQITAVAPAGATTGKITVTTTLGTATSAGNFNVLPKITSFTPASGAVGAVVIISGTTFDGAMDVSFNGVSAEFTADSGTQITAVVPAGATTGKITVTTLLGTATSAGNFNVLPKITSFTPTSAAVGATVTIEGTTFTGATSVKFNGVSGSFTVASASLITAVVPAGATSGKIELTTPAGTDTSSADFLVLPKITSFSPASGVAGAVVTIEGTTFDGATEVSFNGVSGSFAVLSGTQLTATVPAGATTGRIAVTTPAGTGTSSADFIVIKPPTISSFTPASATAGETVTVDGAEFTGATSVKFNGVTASFTVVSNTRITATVPATATTGRISIENPDGTGTSATDLLVLPKVTGFSPASGPAGISVTIEGSGFDSSSAVKFNGVAAQVTVSSATSLKAVLPSGATTGRIEVRTAGGADSSATDFTVVPIAAGVLYVDASAAGLAHGTEHPAGSGLFVGINLFASLQEAIDAAAAGDTIHVAAGDYTGITVDKDITIIGADGAVIHGASPALTVSAGTVSVTNLTFATLSAHPAVLVNGGALTIRGCVASGGTVGVTVDGASALLENNVLTGNPVAGISVLNGGVVDAGDCAGGNVTGLGTGGGVNGSSAGGNDLSGYGFDDAAPWAIQDLNSSAQPVVLAQNNLFGASSGDNIEALLYDDTDGAGNSAVIYSQSTLVVSCPPDVAQCPGNVPAGAATLADFLAQGGMVSSGTAMVEFSDGPIAPGPISGTFTRSYTITDACGNSTGCSQLITVKAETTAVGPDSLAEVCPGGSVSFSTRAAGAGLFLYAWVVNGTLDPTVTGSSYVIASVRPEDAGSYCVIVTGPCSSVTNCATLTVASTGTDPLLQIERQWEEIVLSWAVTCDSYVLEQTASFDAPIAWEAATGQATVVNGRHLLTRPNTESLFYRLRRD